MTRKTVFTFIAFLFFLLFVFFSINHLSLAKFLFTLDISKQQREFLYPLITIIFCKIPTSVIDCFNGPESFALQYIFSVSFFFFFRSKKWTLINGREGRCRRLSLSRHIVVEGLTEVREMSTSKMNCPGIRKCEGGEDGGRKKKRISN